MYKFAICIPTFMRPVQLRGTLDSLAAQIDRHPVAVIVADNDPRQSSRLVVERLQDMENLEYIVEPAAGVVNVRNALLDRARSLDARAVIFVDDDQVVKDGWLDAFASMHDRFPNDILSGPVEYVVTGESSAGLVTEYFQSLSLSRASSFLSITGTGNSLWPTNVLDAVGYPAFRQPFNHIGGEDTDLSMRATSLGFKIRTCSQAAVTEAVPDQRATVGAVTKRLYGNGVIRATLARARGLSRTRLTFGGFFRVGSGLGTGALYLIRPRSKSLLVKSVSRTAGGIGFVCVALRSSSN